MKGSAQATGAFKQCQGIQITATLTGFSPSNSFNIVHTYLFHSASLNKWYSLVLSKKFFFNSRFFSCNLTVLMVFWWMHPDKMGDSLHKIWYVLRAAALLGKQKWGQPIVSEASCTATCSLPLWPISRIGMLVATSVVYVAFSFPQVKTPFLCIQRNSPVTTGGISPATARPKSELEMA